MFLTQFNILILLFYPKDLFLYKFVSNQFIAEFYSMVIKRIYYLLTAKQIN